MIFYVSCLLCRKDERLLFEHLIQPKYMGMNGLSDGEREESKHTNIKKHNAKRSWVVGACLVIVKGNFSSRFNLSLVRLLLAFFAQLQISSD